MQITIEVEPVLTGIVITPTEPPHLILSGVWRTIGLSEEIDLRRWSEDVTDALTDTQRNLLAGIVTRAQVWLAARS